MRPIQAEGLDRVIPSIHADHTVLVPGERWSDGVERIVTPREGYTHAKGNTLAWQLLERDARRAQGENP